MCIYVYKMYDIKIWAQELKEKWTWIKGEKKREQRKQGQMIKAGSNSNKKKGGGR